MSAATESTLSELLDVAKQTNVNIANLSRVISRASSRGNLGQSDSAAASSNAASGLMSLAASVSPVNLALRTFNLSSSLAGRILGTLGSAAGSLVGAVTNLATNFTNFALNAANGQVSLSGFFSQFENLPLGFGTLASVFSRIIGYSEGLLGTYRQLTQVGASFGGSLTEMSNMAARSGLGMDQFSRVVKNNSDIFSTMAGGVDAGIRKFSEQSGKLLDPKSPFGSRLMGLGYTAEESADLLVSYYRSQGAMSAKQLANFDKVGLSTVQLAEEMDLMAKITGRSRKEQEDSMKKLQADQLWQTFKQQLDPAARVAAEATITAAEGMFGSDFAESLKVGMQTGYFNPVNEAARLQVAATGGLSQEIGQQTIDMIKAGRSLDEINLTLIKGGKQSSEYAQQMADATGGALNYNSALKAAISPVLAFGNKTRNQTAEELIKNARLQQEKQKKENEQAAALANAQNNLRNFVNQFTIMLNGIIDPLIVPISDLGTMLIDSLRPGVAALADFFQSDRFKNGMKNIIGWFTDTFIKLKNIRSYEDLKSVLVEQGTKAFNAIVDTLAPLFRNTIKPVLEKLWTDMKPPVLKFFSDLFEDMLIMMTDLLTNTFPNAAKALGIGSKDMKEQREITRSNEFALLRQYIEEKSGTKMISGDTQALINMFKNMNDPKNNEAKQLFEAWKADRAKKENQNAPVATPVSRASGSLGTVGRLIENFGSGTPAVLHGEEGVVTKDQMNQIISGAVQMGQQSQSSSGASPGFEKITSMLASALQQLAVLMKENNEYTRRNLDATRELSGNLWAS